MYLSKMLNVLLQVLSYTLLADPYLLASSTYSELRRNIQKTFINVYICRGDQVGVGGIPLSTSGRFIFHSFPRINMALTVLVTRANIIAGMVSCRKKGVGLLNINLSLC